MGKEKPSAGNGFTALGITAKPAEKSSSSGPPIDLYFMSCRAAVLPQLWNGTGWSQHVCKIRPQVPVRSI